MTPKGDGKRPQDVQSDISSLGKADSSHARRPLDVAMWSIQTVNRLLGPGPTLVAGAAIPA